MKLPPKPNPSTKRRLTPPTAWPSKKSDTDQLPIALDSDHPLAGRTRTGRRILVVDDDPGVRDSLRAVLLQEGYIALAASDGLQAMVAAAEGGPDLVLLDLNMPGQNGWDTFQELTSEHPTLPIIIITARPNQMFTALGAGAGALLEKPLDIPMLLATISRLLGEPPPVRLARLAGRKAEFFYSAGQEEGWKPAHTGDV